MKKPDYTYQDRSNKAKLSDHTILVVEDDLTSFYLIKEILSEDFSGIINKKNGLEAIDFLEQNHSDVDLIIMDIIMPKKDGISTTKILREKGIDTPIIAVTADNSENNKNECLKAGCNKYLVKPLIIEEFIETIYESLGILNP